MSVKLINDIPMTEEECIEENMTLIWHLLHKNFPIQVKDPVLKDDLFSEGCIGLIKSYRKFDPTHGTKFSTFASTYIIGMMRRYLRDKKSVIKLPRSALNIRSKIKQANLLDSSLSPEEIANEIGESVEKVKEALSVYNPIVSLNIKKDNDEDKSDELLVSISENDDYTSMYLEEFLSTLPLREQKVIRLRMDGKSQLDIGKVIGITQVSVSRILNRIFKSYQNYIKGDDHTMSKYSQETIKKVEDLLKNTKKPVSSIAEETGMSVYSVHYYSQKIRNNSSSQKKSEPISKSRKTPIEKAIDEKPYKQTTTLSNIATQQYKKMIDERDERIQILEEELKEAELKNKKFSKSIDQLTKEKSQLLDRITALDEALTNQEKIGDESSQEITQQLESLMKKHDLLLQYVLIDNSLLSHESIPS